jgi:hypothetical protein
MNGQGGAGSGPFPKDSTGAEVRRRGRKDGGRRFGVDEAVASSLRERGTGGKRMKDEG